MKKTHILIVEEQKTAYKTLQEKLTKENFSVAPYTPSVDAALQQIHKKRPDIVLLDINLEGEKSGIDLGKILAEKFNIPFIYVTELADDYTFFQALKTRHEDFIKKSVLPDNFKEILRSIYTVLERQKNKPRITKIPVGIEVLSDYLESSKVFGINEISKITVNFKDVLYFSLDYFENQQGKPEKPNSNYIWLKTKAGEIFFLRTSLSDIYDTLPDYFGRNNAQYIVNIHFIEGRINASKIKIGRKILKITDTYKKEFMERYHKIYLVKK